MRRRPNRVDTYTNGEEIQRQRTREVKRKENTKVVRTFVLDGPFHRSCLRSEPIMYEVIGCNDVDKHRSRTNIQRNKGGNILTGQKDYTERNTKIANIWKKIAR